MICWAVQKNKLIMLESLELRAMCLLTPSGSSASTETKSVHRMRLFAPVPACFPAFGVCVCLFSLVWWVGLCLGNPHQLGFVHAPVVAMLAEGNIPIVAPLHVCMRGFAAFATPPRKSCGRSLMLQVSWPGSASVSRCVPLSSKYWVRDAATPRGCHGSRLQIGRRCKAQERNTGKKVHTARPPLCCGLAGPAGLCGLVKLHHSPTVWHHRRGASVRRLTMPVTLKLSARPSVGSMVVSLRSPTEAHAHKLQTWADVAKATGHPDPWCLDPILYDTSAPLESRVQVPGRLPHCCQARIGPQLPGRLTFTSGVSSVRQPEDVVRRSRRQHCRSCASPSSAAPWLHWSQPGRVHSGYLVSPPGGCSGRSRRPTLRSDARPSHM